MVIVVIIALCIFLLASRERKNIYMGFLLSPILPCILHSLCFDFVLFPFELAVCYGIIIFVAAPAYFLLARRWQANLLVCTGFGFFLSAGAAFIGLVGFLIVAPDSYNDIALAVLFSISAIILGMGISLMFWLIALSPLCQKCELA